MSPIMHPGDIDEGPVPAVARPFQVGDRVRITDNLRHNQHPDAQYVFDGVVEKIDPAADPDSEHKYGPYLWAETEAYTSPLSGEVFDRVFCPMTDDLTTGSDGDYTLGRTIELLEPAPTDTSGGAVTSTPAPSEAPAPDHGPLAATLSDTTLAKVLSRPAHVPSIVLLDRDAAAQHLAYAVTEALAVMTRTGRLSNGGPMAEALRQALAEYRETI